MEFGRQEQGTTGLEAEAWRRPREGRQLDSATTGRPREDETEDALRSDGRLDISKPLSSWKVEAQAEAGRLESKNLGSARKRIRKGTTKSFGSE